MTYDSRTGLLASGAPGWLRAVIYCTFLIIAQSFLSRLFSPTGLIPPDLFLLTAVAIARRWNATTAVTAAYAMGFGQDILGAGMLGFHASGLAGAALISSFSRGASLSLPVQAFISVVAGFIGQWITFIITTYILKSEIITFDSFLRIVPSSFLSTCILLLPWQILTDYALGRARDDLG